MASLNLIMYLENSKEEVVLGFTIDNKLTFGIHIKKAGQKLGALLRITNYLNSSQKKTYFELNYKISIRLLSFIL